ncbi:sialin-like [Tropilaelaps mercedesae]|uniref:Sialin-like n=1 Tax=Tropilaelaps mercedesae TaxID=418985 RepID=A0A1V9XE86_9ACAR|nr:sialin-like [Tropilaelaps mercedesae]
MASMCSIPVRYLVSSMVFFAFVFDAALRCSLSITILVMVNQTTHISPHGSFIHKKWIEPGGEQGIGKLPNYSFDWDSVTQSWVLNSVYIGILCSQFPAGHFAESFSLKWILGYGVFFMSVLQLLSPLVVWWNVWAFVALRILAGLSIGAIFPSANALISRWSSVQERTILITIATQGYVIGTTITMFVAGPLCKQFGWESVFYVFGAAGVVWSLLCYVCVASSPEKHLWISEEERAMIIANRPGDFSRNRLIPWGSIVLSGPVLIFCIRTFASSVLYTTLLIYTPLFLDHMYKIDLVTNGWISGVSNIMSSIVALISSVMADRLLQSGCSINKVRKTFATLAIVLPAFTVLLISAMEYSIVVIAGLIVLTNTLGGLAGGSDSALPIDLSAEYAGAVSACVNFVANLGAILTPIAVGWLLEEKEDFRHWNIILSGSALTALIGTWIFIKFGSAEKQDWSVPSTDETTPLLVEPL